MIVDPDQYDPEDRKRRLGYAMSRVASNLITLKLWLKHPDADRPRIRQEIANLETELDELTDKIKYIP
jgi:hypothetical protein